MNEKEGIWIKYECGSNPKDVRGFGKYNTDIMNSVAYELNTCACYIYYTKDKDGNCTIPRLLISSELKSDFLEIKGAGERSDVEPDMLGALEEKLNELPHNENIDLKLRDAKILTDIENKDLNNIPLEKEEIIFLYELEHYIKGFGHYKDKRIWEIRLRRDTKQDIATLFNCKKENVATSISDFDDNNIIVYFDDIGLEYEGEKLPDTFKNLMVILGRANFKNLESAENLQSLTYVKSDLCLPKIRYSRGLEKLQQVGGLELDSMVEATGLCNLKSINGSARCQNLRSAVGLENLKFIANGAYFNSLTSAVGLNNLESIGYDSRHQDDGPFKVGADFDSLVSADGFESLKAIYICSNFENMIDATAFGKCLEEVWDYVNFRSLSSTKGLEKVNLVNYKSITNLADKIKSKDEDKCTKVYKA